MNFESFLSGKLVSASEENWLVNFEIKMRSVLGMNFSLRSSRKFIVHDGSLVQKRARPRVPLFRH